MSNFDKIVMPWRLVGSFWLSKIQTKNYTISINSKRNENKRIATCVFIGKKKTCETIANVIRKRNNRESIVLMAKWIIFVHWRKKSANTLTLSLFLSLPYSVSNVLEYVVVLRGHFMQAPDGNRPMNLEMNSVPSRTVCQKQHHRFYFD